MLVPAIINTSRLLPIVILIGLSLSGCFDVIKEEKKEKLIYYNHREIIKQIRLNKDVIVEWYYYSLVTGYSPGFVDFKTKKGHTLICKSGYLSDIYLKHDTLFLQLWRRDYLGLNKKNRYHLAIAIDTAGKQPF